MHIEILKEINISAFTGNVYCLFAGHKISLFVLFSAIYRSAASFINWQFL